MRTYILLVAAIGLLLLTSSDQCVALSLYKYKQKLLFLPSQNQEEERELAIAFTFSGQWPMASKQTLLFVVVVAAAVAFLPALAVATEHTVGDDKGWVLGFDYATWAETKQFKVGDTLVFNYKSPNHTVVEVGGADFKTCTKPETAAEWSSGQDRVDLDKAGSRWFFCGVGEHCKRNMKLKITVLADDDAGAAPAPGSPSTVPPAPPASSPAGKVQARVAQAVAAVTIAAALVL